MDTLWRWLDNVTVVPIWPTSKCLAAFPDNDGSLEVLKATLNQALREEEDQTRRPSDPVPVNAPVADRMRESLAGRHALCLYNERLQTMPYLYFPRDKQRHLRLLVHFYSFVFHHDWKVDLWMKRFMRDQLRYRDGLFCAAARVVRALRELSRQQGRSGVFDTLHVRRGDFTKWKTTKTSQLLSAKDIYNRIKDVVEPESVVFIATDEHDKAFFMPLGKHFTVRFLDDFLHLLQGIDSNFYGVIDQLVAARGRVFFGTYYSTYVLRIGSELARDCMLLTHHCRFSAYITRLIGYYSTKEKQTGYEKGALRHAYYLDSHRNVTHTYHAPLNSWKREFPSAWMDIDFG
jgi:hypothetical protein